MQACLMLMLGETCTGKDSVAIAHAFDSELGWGNEQQLTTEVSFSGLGCGVMKSEDMYGITLRQRMSDLDIDQSDMIRISLWGLAENRTTSALMIISMQDTAGNVYMWQGVPLGLDVKGTGKWCKAEFVRELPPIKDPSDELLIYILKKKHEEVLYYDDLKIWLIDA